MKRPPPSPRRYGYAVLLFAATMILGGCAVGPDYHRPALPVPAAFKEGGLTWTEITPARPKTMPSAWWQGFDDPKLDRLVERAMRANPDIRSALAAYDSSLAALQIDRGALLPQLGLGADGTRSKSAATAYLPPSTAQALHLTGTQNTVEVQGQAHWEVDLWGGLRRSVEEGRAQAQAQRAEVGDARLSIAATLVDDYLQLRQADIDIHLIEGELVVYERLAAMNREGRRYGTASDDDVRQADDQVDSTASSLAALRATRASYEHALAALVGTAPANFAIAPDPSYRFHWPKVPTMLPSQLLEHRPDVVGAERGVQAANAQIGVQKAAFFPSLVLNASGGYRSSSMSNLFSLPNEVWSLGPQLAETLFDGGERRAAVRRAHADYEVQVANYRKAVLQAFQDVEDSLSDAHQAAEQLRRQRAIEQRQHALLRSRLAALTYGTADSFDVLTQRVQWLEAEQSLAGAESAAAQQQVALIRALGGGWQGGRTTLPGATSSKHASL